MSANLIKGETYSFRYRVKNIVGWSQYSDTTSAVAADAPSKPMNAPTIIGDPSATSVTVLLDHETVEDGGSPISSYILEVCQDNSARTLCLIDAQFNSLASYSSTVQHTLTVAADSLVTGAIYKIRYRAQNSVGGIGPASDPLSVAFADKPVASTTISKNMQLSSKSSLSLYWSDVVVPAG